MFHVKQLYNEGEFLIYIDVLKKDIEELKKVAEKWDVEGDWDKGWSTGRISAYNDILRLIENYREVYKIVK